MTATLRAAPDQARELYDQGARLFDLGAYEDAITKFEAAYALSGAPELLLNLAQAYRLWGPAHCAKALRLYRTYLDKRPDSPHRAEVLRRIEAMQQCPSQPLRSATAQQHRPPPAAPIAAAPIDDPDDGAGWRTGAWVSGGIAAVAAIAGGVSWYSAAHRGNELDTVCTDGVCPPSQASLIESYDRMRTIALTSAIIGGLSGVASVYCIVRVGGSSSQRELSAWVGHHALGVRVAF
jgi:hypothetical protein